MCDDAGRDDTQEILEEIQRLQLEIAREKELVEAEREVVIDRLGELVAELVADPAHPADAAAIRDWILALGDRCLSIERLYLIAKLRLDRIELQIALILRRLAD